ncbi:trace amine-associated receptor 13c-like [Oryzias latipes]|uniref:trace amine-associated receptor 13c-like n=1 Tax=Oryzias latipes TaxID=8090 RepID=UPI000CE24CE7|nr:trace amine-associated receptor 13c-like [Oryzias latipes]
MMEGADLCFPQLLNSSCRKTILPRPVFTIIYILLTLISVLTVSLNLLVIISISHFRELHTSTNLLLLSLAISDFTMGLLMFFQVSFVEGCWYLGDIICILYYTVLFVITSSSIGNMVLISVDRYFAICCPLHYPSRVTTKRARVCVSLCWIFSLITLTGVVKQNMTGRFHSCDGECLVEVTFEEMLADLVVTIVIPITVIILLYVRVFVVAVSQIHAMRSHVAALPWRQTGRGTAKKSELKAAGTLGIVVAAFLLCLCPYYCVNLVGRKISIKSTSLEFVKFLFYFNSFLNPIIYGLFYPWFRKSVKLIVTLQVLKAGSSDAKIL